VFHSSLFSGVDMTTIRRVLVAATLALVALVMVSCKDDKTPTNAKPDGEQKIGKEKGGRGMPKPPPIEPVK
jgi:hypothetical protein